MSIIYMALFIGSYVSIIPKLLDQAAITYDGKEYTYVPNSRILGAIGTYNNNDKDIIAVLPRKIHCKAEITFNEGLYKHLGTSESKNEKDLENGHKIISDIRNVAKELIEEWLENNKIISMEVGSDADKRKYEDELMAAFKTNGVKVVITITNYDEPEDSAGEETDLEKKKIYLDTFDRENNLDKDITNSMYKKVDYYRVGEIRVKNLDKLTYNCLVDIITPTQKITIIFDELVKNQLDLNHAIETALQKAGIDSINTVEEIRVVAMPLDDADDQPLPYDQNYGGRKTRKTRKNKTKRKRNNKQRKSKKHKKQSKRR